MRGCAISIRKKSDIELQVQRKAHFLQYWGTGGATKSSVPSLQNSLISLYRYSARSLLIPLGEIVGGSSPATGTTLAFSEDVYGFFFRVPVLFAEYNAWIIFVKAKMVVRFDLRKFFKVQSKERCPVIAGNQHSSIM